MLEMSRLVTVDAFGDKTSQGFISPVFLCLCLCDVDVHWLPWVPHHFFT